LYSSSLSGSLQRAMRFASSYNSAIAAGVARRQQSSDVVKHAVSIHHHVTQAAMDAAVAVRHHCLATRLPTRRDRRKYGAKNQQLAVQIAPTVTKA
jgi:hypothetical protein